MNKITYGVVKEIYTEGESERISYGIAVYEDVAENGSASILGSVSDICADRESVENLVQLCNEFALSPIHLYDVIEDFSAQ